MKKSKRERLMELRSKLVSTMHVQPYIIYDDETIERLLIAQPKTLDELKSIKGFPSTGKRLKGFGLQIIAIFNNSDSPNNAGKQYAECATALPQQMDF